jgi:hypothetical protein
LLPIWRKPLKFTCGLLEPAIGLPREITSLVATWEGARLAVAGVLLAGMRKPVDVLDTPLLLVAREPTVGMTAPLGALLQFTVVFILVKESS